MFEVMGKSALVTGASRGIGAAAAEDLAKRGVAVLLTARSGDAIAAVAKKITAAGGRAEALAQEATEIARHQFSRTDEIRAHLALAHTQITRGDASACARAGRSFVRARQLIDEQGDKIFRQT